MEWLCLCGLGGHVEGRVLLLVLVGPIGQEGGEVDLLAQRVHHLHVEDAAGLHGRPAVRHIVDTGRGAIVRHWGGGTWAIMALDLYYML